MNREALLETLAQWINQRPGLDPRNYISDYRDADGRAAYRSEARSITRQLHDARALLRYIKLHPTIDAQRILDAARGRLTIKPAGESFEIDYCTGQYWPTEYRSAAARVMASAIWDYFRKDCIRSEGADSIRALAKKEFPAPIARRWFN